MARTGLRLQHRIAIPLVLVALVAMSAAALVALSVIARTLRARVEARALSASEIVSRPDFALNPAILRTVKEITGADVITYTPGGAALASTLAQPDSDPIAASVRESDGAPAALAAAEDAPVTRELSCGGVPCHVVFRRLGGRSDAVVAVVSPLGEVSTATAAITRALLVALALILAAVVLVSQIVARRVTRPIDRLVAVTRDVPAAGAAGRAPAGDDEIGRLGAAFNDMLDRLEESRDALVRSEKLSLAGLLAARVAHDIRNPLASMKIQAQLLRSRLRDERDQATVAAVLHDITTVESVIRNLLELARPAGLKLEPRSLNDVVRELLQQITAQLTHRKIRVKTELDAELPPVALDGERFTQAILNVVINAADAMPSGGELIVRTSRAPGGGVALEVCDDGVGIDPAMGDRVFDPFVSSKRDGVGLGLVNVKAVVESHGGRITLSPRQPRGTCATISLPATAEVHG